MTRILGRPARACAAATLLCAGGAAMQPAHGQTLGGLQSNVGADSRVGDLRPQLERYFQGVDSTVSRPQWIITPSIDVQVGATDNAYRQQGPAKADVFTIISPAVVVSGDTSRLKLNAFYSPQIIEYASTPRENQVSQFANGNALLTVVPDLFFIDARGSVTQQSLTGGGFYQGQQQTFSTQDDVQTTTVSINPYLQRQFGGYGQARVGYTFARTLQDLQDDRSAAINNSGLGTQALGTIGNLTTQREDAFYSTGENLGRFNDQVTAAATQYAGVGSYHGAFRNEISNQLSYAVDHTVTLLASIGYQDLRYGGTPGYRFTGPSYAFGVRYAPNPDTNITIEYGEHDGDDNLSFDGQYAITARLRLLARYSTGITSDLEQSQSLLGSTTVGATGRLTDTATGLPVTTSTGFSGLQNGIYRLKRFSATLLFLQDRDSYTVSINNDDRTALNATTVLSGTTVLPAGTNTNSTYASATWQHELSPTLSSVLSAQFGVTNSAFQVGGTALQDQTTFSVSAGLNKQLTETLSATARYIYTDQSGGGQGSSLAGFGTGSYASNTVLFGLHKSF